jgi:hypothetical protein
VLRTFSGTEQRKRRGGRRAEEKPAIENSVIYLGFLSNYRNDH